MAWSRHLRVPMLVYAVVLLVLRRYQMPLAGREPRYDEEHDADGYEGEDDTQPDLFGQRLQETEHVGYLLDGFLHHDADPKRGEGFCKVDHSLSFCGYGQRRNGDIRFLYIKNRIVK